MTGFKNLKFIPTFDTRLSSIVELDSKYNKICIRHSILKNLPIIPDATLGFYSINQLTRILLRVELKGSV